MIPDVVQEAGLQAVAIFEASVAKGNSVRLATMLALRKAPGADTDDQFLASQGTLLKQFDGNEAALKMHIESAQKHGYTPGVNDVYLPQLAQFSGDPRAHVKSKGEAIRYAESLGVGCTYMGKEMLKSRQPERDWMETADVMSDDLVAEALPKLLAEDSSLKKRSKQEQKEAVLERHGGTITRKVLKK